MLNTPTRVCAKCRTNPITTTGAYCSPCRASYAKGRYLRLPNDELGRKLVAEYQTQKAKVEK